MHARTYANATVRCGGLRTWDRDGAQEVDPNDEILFLLNDIVNRCLVATPTSRPTALQINRKIAELIRNLTRGLDDDPHTEW